VSDATVIAQLWPLVKPGFSTERIGPGEKGARFTYNAPVERIEMAGERATGVKVLAQHIKLEVATCQKTGRPCII
jgi:hypothetical protein